MPNKYRLKLKLVFVESILAVGAFGIMMPIMTEFWKSIGMNQTFIGLTQMICTIVIVLLDIPMGYIADRYNRKMLNVIGDFKMAYYGMQCIGTSNTCNYMDINTDVN